MDSGSDGARRLAGRRVHRLFLAATALAVAVAAAGLVRPVPVTAASRLEVGRWGIATALVTVALVARVRVHIGATRMSLAWGEAAVVVALGLVPAGWVASTLLVGGGLAMVALGALGEHRDPSHMAYNASSLALAGAAAAAIAQAIDPPYRVPLSPGVAVALLAAAFTYALVSIVAAATAVHLATGTPAVDVAGRALRGKATMIIGNVAVGLAVVLIVNADLRWLLLLAPVVWPLWLAYSYRLRSDDERSGWQVFATATQALNRLDERDVAEAGIAGAMRLFGAGEAEVLLGTDGTRVVYRSPGASHLGSAPAPPAGGGRPGRATRGPGRVTSRPLLVAGAPIGELRLWFADPAQLRQREQARLSAYGDALAGALHDAAAHQKLLAMAEKSAHAALHDPLTGLANRATLLSGGDADLRMRDRDAPVAMMVLDVAHFREVNDTLGHTAGDEVLRVSATRIAARCRPGEFAARVGGDEFALLMIPPVDGVGDGGPEVGAVDGDAGAGAVEDRVDGEEAMRAYAVRRAGDLLDLLATPTEVAGVPVVVEASIGVAVATAGSCDATELLRRATIAGRRAKDGNGPVVCYEAATDEASTDRLALLAELREALATPHELVLVFQPVINLSTGAATGAEALIRWRHPRRGELTPGEFIDVLEKSELVGPFGRYVIDRALGVAAQWAAQGLTVPISVNLSARNLLDRNLPDQVAEMLARHRVPAGMLVLEITETVLVPETPVVGEVLGRLRRLGVQLAVDDFGTGFSSLSFLTRVQVDEVKVDQTFVARMAESAEALAIVRTTVDLARSLELRVVAEGVETAEQRAMLVDLGCSAAQGFHFFRPLAPEKAVTAMRGLGAGRVIPLRGEDVS